MEHAETSAPMANTPFKEGSRVVWFLARYFLGFAILWAIFFGLYKALPFLTPGAEVIFQAKLDRELRGSIFPPDSTAHKVIIFGDSRILAGFVPEEFDALAAEHGLNVVSFNSGYPGNAQFVPQLERIVANKSNVPDILLLTNPWGNSIQSDILHPLPDDGAIANRLFPFRELIRNAASVLANVGKHGGMLNFIRDSKLNVARMQQDRGYYALLELAETPNATLPDNFHFTSDLPNKVDLRTADPESKELTALNAIVREHRIQCYFVPNPVRAGMRAPAPEVDRQFAELLDRYTSCKLIGPDYYLYPNRLYSDVWHTNPAGARIYTEALYKLLAKQIEEH